MLDLIIHATMKMLQICESKVQMIHLTPCTEYAYMYIPIHLIQKYAYILMIVKWGVGGGAKHATLF